MVEAIAKASPVTSNNAAAKTQAPSASDPTKSSGARTVSAPFQIKTMQDRDRWLKMIIYGKHGVGKTELAASIVDVPSMNDVLMIDAESGDMTLQDSIRVENADKINHIKVTTFKQVAEIHTYLKAMCKFRDAGDSENSYKLHSQVTGYSVAELKSMGPPPNYKSVIMDSLTEIDVYCTYGILNIDVDKVLKGDTSEIDVAGWPEFRKNNEMVKLLVRAYRDLPMNVIFTCAESWTQDEMKKFHYSPALTGKLSAQVQGFVDVVGYLVTGNPIEGKEVPRRLYVQPMSGSARFDAKCRRPQFKGSFFDDPHMTEIVKAFALGQ